MFKSYRPDKRSQTVVPAECKDGLEQDQSSLCFDESDQGYELYWGFHVFECTADLPYECGMMCTTSEAECTETLKEQGTSAFYFITSLAAQDYYHAIVFGAETTEAFAIAVCDQD